MPRWLPIVIGGACIALLGLLAWIFELVDVLFSGFLVLFTGLLLKASRDFHRWTKEWTEAQYRPCPVITKGSLSHDKANVTIKLDMMNPGQSGLLYRATQIDDCSISKFLANTFFREEAVWQPYQIKAVELVSPLKDAAQFDNFLEEKKSPGFCIAITEQYVSGGLAVKNSVTDIRITANAKGGWEIARVFPVEPVPVKRRQQK